MNQKIKDKTLKRLRSFLGDNLLSISEEYRYPLIHIKRDSLHETCRLMKNELHFDYLIDILGTDRNTPEERFEVIYHLLSLSHQLRFFIKVYVDEKKITLPTVTDIWKSANWNEREVYDMFGVRFKGHPDLRRIFMPEDFKYHPLRKEFPLLGIPGSLDLPDSTSDQD